MDRKQCGACCRKHVMQARALLLETHKGYPHHRDFAIGHLAEAEDEGVLIMPETVALIRAERLKIEADIHYMPDFVKLTKSIAMDAMLPGTEGL